MGRNAGTYVLQEYHTQQHMYRRISYTAGETWGGWSRNIICNEYYFANSEMREIELESNSNYIVTACHGSDTLAGCLLCIRTSNSSIGMITCYTGSNISVSRDGLKLIIEASYLYVNIIKL